MQTIFHRASRCTKKGTIALVLLAATLLSTAPILGSTTTPAQQKTTKTTPTVYVCPTPSAYAYHRDSTCRFLLQCSRVIQRADLDKTLHDTRTPCQACYNNR